MTERTRKTDDGTYPLVEEELAKVDERATAKAIPVAENLVVAGIRDVGFYKKFFARLAETNPGWFTEVWGSSAKNEEVLRADNARLAASLRSVDAVPVPKDRPAFVGWKSGVGRTLEERSVEYLVEALATGFFCRVTGCQVWNGDHKEVRTTCRACGAPRPRRA